MNASDEPRLPAWAHDKRWAWVLQSLEPVSTVTLSYLGDGLLSVRLFDSDLNVFDLVSAERLGRAGILGWRPGFRGTHVRVRPVFKLRKRISLEEAKDWVLDFTLKNPEIYESGTTEAEFVERVRAAGSVPELFAAL